MNRKIQQTLTSIILLLAVGLTSARADNDTKPKTTTGKKAGTKLVVKSKPAKPGISAVDSRASEALKRLQRDANGNLKLPDDVENASPKKSSSKQAASKSKPKVITSKKTTAATASKSKPQVISPNKTTAATASKSKPRVINPSKTTATTASKSKPQVISPNKTTAGTASKSKPRVISPSKTTATTASKSKPRVISPSKTTATTASKSKPRVISPSKSTATTASKLKPGGAASKTGLSTKTKIAGGVGGALVVAGGVGIAKSLSGETKSNLDAVKSGAMTKSDFAKKSTANLAEGGAAIYKLKKLSPTSMLLGDTIGTDPLDLAVKGVGDLLNGTDNAKQSIAGMKDAWNDSLTKQAFTDPRSAAQRAGKGVVNTLENVGEGVINAGQKVGQGFDKLENSKFGQDVKKGFENTGQFVDQKAKKFTNTVNKAGNNVKNKLQDAGNSAKKTVADAGNSLKKAGNNAKKFVGGLFKKKK
jgi:hypothetical protein